MKKIKIIEFNTDFTFEIQFFFFPHHFCFLIRKGQMNKIANQEKI